MRLLNVTVPLAALLLCTMTATAGENLLRNPGFEEIPGPGQGQGIMPSEWLVASSSPDTYSNDGSYGLAPEAFGNFTGVVAYNGIRWIAGWSTAIEVPAQLLTEPLTPGASYRLAVYLHQATRPDLAHPGAYEIRLAASANPTGALTVATWAPTESDDEWEYRSIEFVAPKEASTLPFLLLVPYGADGASAYPGVDDIELIALACLGDLNGDGQVGAADLAILLSGWEGAGPADLNGSGVVDAVDLALLLAAWGACG